jgi:cation:H+ antiporter
MLGAAIIIVVVGSFAKAGKIDGIGTVTSILLIVIFVIAMVDNIRAAVKAVKGGKEEKLGPEAKTKAVIFSNILKFILGALAIVFGADLLVDKGSIIAASLGISERVISVTIIAIGTSLPELVTTITAVIKKQSSLGVGNIIGANIMDLTFIMPVCNLISGKPLPVSESVAMIDFPACLVVGLVAVIPMLITKKFTRAQGGVMLLLYAIYMVLTVLGVDKLASMF